MMAVLAGEWKRSLCVLYLLLIPLLSTCLESGEVDCVTSDGCGKCVCVCVCVCVEVFLDIQFQCVCTMDESWRQETLFSQLMAAMSGQL